MVLYVSCSLCLPGLPPRRAGHSQGGQEVRGDPGFTVHALKGVEERSCFVNACWSIEIKAVEALPAGYSLIITLYSDTRKNYCMSPMQCNHNL